MSVSRTAASARLTWFVLTCLLGSTVAIVALTPVPRLRAQDPPPPSYDPAGLEPDRSYFGELPFESVDTVNGNVILTFTDLVLPGNAGMDLRVIRTYNRQLPLRWYFGFAGVPLSIVRPEGNGTEGHNPELVMGDGSRRRARPVNSVSNDTVFLTDDFWRYTTTTRKLEMPNGWTAIYETRDTSAMLVEVHDPWGNSITPT